MMKICCNVYDKYRKSKKTKTPYIFKNILDLSIVYSRCGHEYIKYIKYIILSEENINQEFRLKI